MDGKTTIFGIPIEQMYVAYQFYQKNNIDINRFADAYSAGFWDGVEECKKSLQKCIANHEPCYRDEGARVD